MAYNQRGLSPWVFDGGELLKVSLILVAAGKGNRMGAIKKQFLPLGNLPLYIHPLRIFDRCGLINDGVIVVPEEDRERVSEEVSGLDLKKNYLIVNGGIQRQDSVKMGLRAISSDIVVIHDAVRPFVSEKMIVDCVMEAEKEGAAAVAIPSVDSLKEISEDLYICASVPREKIWHAQTPQAFRYALLKTAMEYAEKNSLNFSDEASLFTYLGIKVKVVPGSPLNMKITTESDYIIARAVYGSMIKDENWNRV